MDKDHFGSLYHPGSLSSFELNHLHADATLGGVDFADGGLPGLAGVSRGGRVALDLKLARVAAAIAHLGAAIASPDEPYAPQPIHAPQPPLGPWDGGAADPAARWPRRGHGESDSRPAGSDLRGTPRVRTAPPAVLRRSAPPRPASRRGSGRVEKYRNRIALRAVAARLLEVREEERTRIARELHDELGQQLTGLKMQLCALGARHGGGDLAPLAPKLTELTASIDQLVDSVRRIAADMRPPLFDQLGLRASIEALVEDFAGRSGIECDLSLAVADERLSPIAAVAVYRIVQEALTNAARHSCAHRVEIHLAEEAERIRLDIADDGVGLDATAAGEQHHLGLRGISERAAALGGTAVTHGGACGGTTVHITLPLSTVAALGPKGSNRVF